MSEASTTQIQDWIERCRKGDVTARKSQHPTQTHIELTIDCGV